MINADVNIYMDALGLLLSDKTDIREEIKSQLQQGDEMFFDSIRDGLQDEAEDKGIDADKITDAFIEDSVDELMKYISFNEENITFDYPESEACGDLKVVAFRIPCDFDSDRYIKDKTSPAEADTGTKYWDIHMTVKNDCKEGYSVFVEAADAQEAVDIMKEKHLYEEPEDLDNIDYVDEITKEDYVASVGHTSDNASSDYEYIAGNLKTWDEAVEYGYHENKAFIQDVVDRYVSNKKLIDDDYSEINAKDDAIEDTLRAWKERNEDV